jgi:hypothetical protein
VQLWRFEDPVLGDRKIPIFQEPTKGKVLVEPGSRFKVDVAGEEGVGGDRIKSIGTRQFRYLFGRLTFRDFLNLFQ